MRRVGRFVVMAYRGQEYLLNYSPSVQKMQRQVFKILKELKAPREAYAEALRATSDLFAINRPSGQNSHECGRRGA